MRTKNVSGTNRMEAFSDGVFAIAITLLILDIKVPNPLQGRIPRSLEASLLLNWPAYLGYIVSFIMIGIYWVHHHYLLRLFRGTTHVLNLLNLNLLLWVCVIPFPTSVLSGYMNVPGAQRTAVMLYIGSLCAPGAAWFLLWLYAIAGERLIDPRLDKRFVRFLTAQYLFSTLYYLAALAVAYWNYTAGLVMVLLLTLGYMLPPKPPVYREGAASPIGA